MRAGQGELGGIVIELGAKPLRGRVAELAILRVAGCDVIGIGGALVVLQMARYAVRSERRILPVGMAESTSDRGVCASQRKLGGAMVECGSQPLRSGVAELTILWEAGGGMIGVVRGLVVLQMARMACSGQGRVLAARVALLACGRDVRAG